jgi:hypothetical protein
VSGRSHVTKIVADLTKALENRLSLEAFCEGNMVYQTYGANKGKQTSSAASDVGSARAHRHSLPRPVLQRVGAVSHGTA